MNGIPTNETIIRYTGSSSNLLRRDHLTLQEIRPVLAQWKTAPVEPRPNDLRDTESDPGLLLFAILMLGMIFVACLLLLGIIVVLLLIVAVSGMVGIISVAFLTGALQRSVSSGFRALILMLGIVGGLLLGVGGTWAVTLFGQFGSNTPMHLAVGAVTGSVLGIGSAWTFNLAWTRIATWLAAKFRRNTEPS